MIEYDAYDNQIQSWPGEGRHLLAHYDDHSIWVYQAYRPAIATWAVANQRFGGEFSYGRMSWIKPNFLWMMYRCGWASKEGQERVLAVRVRRPFFDEILRRAVPSSFDASRYGSIDAWRHALGDSEVRLQWDPDHDPHGRPLERRAIQLGLRGDTLRLYGETELLCIKDITPFVVQQRDRVGDDIERLEMPVERVYGPPADAATVVGIDQYSPSSDGRNLGQ